MSGHVHERSLVFAIVTARLSRHSPIANIVADKNGNCYYLARGFTHNRAPVPIQLKMDRIVTFTYTDNDGKPVIHDIIRHEIMLFNRYSRMIRGTGEARHQVFVDAFRCLIDGDEDLLDGIVPEGVPFVCGLKIEWESHRHKDRANFDMQPGAVLTSEPINFFGCPWKVTNRSLWINPPDYSTAPAVFGKKNPYIKMSAKCYPPALDSGRALDEILCFTHKGEDIWIRLWMNSPIRRSIVARRDNYTIQEYKPGKEYFVGVVRSWLNDDFFEVLTYREVKNPEKHKGLKLGKFEADEYIERLNKFMEPCSRNNDLECYSPDDSIFE